MWTRRSSAVLLAASSLLLPMVFGGGEAVAQRQASSASALRALVRQTNALPRTVGSRSQRAQLRRGARGARRSSARGRQCTAVAQLTRYRRVLRGVRTRRGSRFRRANQRLAALGPASMRASRALLAGPRTRRCGGGVAQPTRRQTSTRVLRSDVDGMRLRVQLPALRFVERTAGGRTWTQLMLPDTDAPGRPGTPGIPVVSNTFAVPDGATVEVNGTATQRYRLDGVDVFPVQPEPVDQDRPAPDFDEGRFADRPFTLSDRAYRQRGPVPAEPAAGGIIGQSRDLTIGNLQIPAAQYDAAARSLTVFTSIDVTVSFDGGAKTFNEELGSPWEQPARRLAASLLNSNITRVPIREAIRRCGEEMMVVTNPSTLAAANTFAAARNAAGIRTAVFQTGSDPGQIGTTAAAIQTFIRSHLNRFFCIRPSYVTIMGDDDLVPTFPGISGIPSDLQYSMKNDADELPDVAVGRIIGNDQAAVQTAVDKIIGYEAGPPATPRFLTRATIAAQFQDDDADGRENRTFIQFAETVRNGLVRRGVAVDRIYGEHPGNNPLKFNDGTDLPAALKKPAFAWDGDGADVSAAWNAGRFMVIHRDHGWSDGWGTPGFSTTNVNALTNGANLPVVLSINCSSGAYDYDETSFAGESLVKADGGSVGVFGDTRDSPSWHNTQIALGFVDGLLPSVLPAEGPADRQRVGDALINGKLRLAGLAPPATDPSTRNELYLWHYFGDPSMQMWGGQRLLVFDPSLFTAVLDRAFQPPPGPDPPPYVVNVSVPFELNGQPVSLLRNGEVVGKGVAGGGFVQIPASFGDGDPKQGELAVAAEGDGAQPVRVPVQVPAPPPAGTTLTQTCPAEPVPLGREITVTGTLRDVPQGTQVTVTFAAPGGGRVVPVSAATDAQGNWTASLGTGRGESGDWTIRSSYAGDSTHRASSAGPCTVTVGSG